MHTFNVEQEGERLRLTIGGELSIYSADSFFNEHIKPLEKNKNVTLDLSGVEEIDTAGIQILLVLKRSLAEHSATLSLTTVSASVQKYLQLFRLGSEFMTDNGKLSCK